MTSKGANMTETFSSVDRFSVLAVRQGITLGALYSSNRDDFGLVLAAAAAAFAPGRAYAEREVNDILREWLTHAGAMLDVDHVELRRWLVDNRLLDRDGFGRAYATGTPAPELAAIVAALRGRDLAGLATNARARDALERAERKQKWADNRRPESGND
jgi:hypothetical protein